MVRKQITMTEEQFSYLQELSRKSGRSLSELIRVAVDRLRDRAELPIGPALELIGAFQADCDDVSERHDEYFPEEP